jgi:hypothetical protein
MGFIAHLQLGITNESLWTLYSLQLSISQLSLLQLQLTLTTESQLLLSLFSENLIESLP